MLVLLLKQLPRQKVLNIDQENTFWPICPFNVPIGYYFTYLCDQNHQSDIFMLFKSSTKQLNYLNQGQNRAFIRGSLYVLIALLCGVSLTTGQAPFHASADFIGLDSNLYMHVSKYFTSEIFNQSYNGYQIQRIFPFALINVLFQAFQYLLVLHY